MDLDKSKPFVEVFGHGPIHKYMQFGRYYNGQGKEIHQDGKAVTPKEKMERAKIEIDNIEAEKKRLLKAELRKLEREQKELQDEARLMFFVEAAKNLDRLDGRLSDYNTKEKIMAALDLLEYPYEEAAKKDELEEILTGIFDAAG